MKETSEPEFPFWHSGRHRLYIQPPPLEVFFSSFPSRATAVALKGSALPPPGTEKRGSASFQAISHTHLRPLPHILHQIIDPVGVTFVNGSDAPHHGGMDFDDLFQLDHTAHIPSFFSTLFLNTVADHDAILQMKHANRNLLFDFNSGIRGARAQDTSASEENNPVIKKWRA
jgi:hypothetical protein